jgi:hypothetical protein
VNISRFFKSTSRISEIFIFVLSAIIVLFLFKDILLENRLLFGTDFFTAYLGMKQFLYNEIHNHHSIPFWNPFIFSGLPYLAHFESTIFYPLDLLFYLIPPERAYGYTIIVHVFLTFLGMYFLGKSFGFGVTGSFAAATVYSFNCLMMATLYDGQMFRTQSYLWIPIILWCLNKAISSRSLKLHAALAGLFWGFQILSGAPQDAFYTLFAGMLFLAVNLRFNRQMNRWNLRILAIAGMLLFVGSGVAAIQIIPSFELINHSVRSVLNAYEDATVGSYPPQGLATLVMPHFFGNYATGNFWVSDVPWSVPLYNLYVGITPIMLIFFVSRSNKNHQKIFPYAIILAVFALFLAMGSYTPFYKLIYHLPGFDKIRAPAKIIVLWVFAWALLTGKLFSNLLSSHKEFVSSRIKWIFFVLILLVILNLVFLSENSFILKVFYPFIPDSAILSRMPDAQVMIANQFHRFILLFAVSGILLYLFARNLITSKLAGAFLCAILLLDLMHANQGAVRHRDEVYAWAAQTKIDLDETMGKDKSVYRVGSYPFGTGANIEMYLGYQTVNGYNPLFLHRYYQYINRYRFSKNSVSEGWIVFFYETFEDSVLMDLLNVKYEISHQNKNYALRESFFPRAFIVPECKIMESKDMLDFMVSKDFDPTVTVLLEKEENGPCIETFSRANYRSQSRILSYRPDEIRIETDSNYPGYLLLSEVFYPGWSAFVDGNPKRILRGNFLFRVIEMPAGNHQVTLVFRPVSIKIGMAVTIFTLSALLLAGLVHFLRRTRSQPHVEIPEGPS